jgi:hypothetical protein
LIGQQKQIYHDAGRIKEQRLLDGLLDETAKRIARKCFTIDIGYICAQDERRLALARYILEDWGQAGTELNGVRVRLNDGSDDVLHIFDVIQERSFVKEAVIDSHIETATVLAK